MNRKLFALSTVVALAACATTKSNVTMAGNAMAAPQPDRRIGLRSGWFDAAEASWNLHLVSTTQPTPGFINRNDPGDSRTWNSDLAFTGKYVIQGNFSGYQVWDVTDPRSPKLFSSYLCPGSQSDVSVHKNLLFESSESLNGRNDCGTQGVADTVSKERLRGIRIYDIADIAHPKLLTTVQTCRGSHTHSVVTDPNDAANVYVYISGSAPVRSPNELAGCSAQAPEQDPNSELFRIEVIQVPVAHPEQAHVVSKPPILADLDPVKAHGEAPEDIAAAAKIAAAARARGEFTVAVFGREQVLPSDFSKHLLDSLVKERGGSGEPTSADSAKLRQELPAMVQRMIGAEGPRRGPQQCHDITAYPAIGLAGGACGGYGVLLDIRDPAHPKRIGAVADSNFSFWHSASFNNDGTKMLFTDEWGGGTQPRCRVTDKPEWGADAIFTLSNNQLGFKGYYKLPAPQTAQENCVAHNGSLIPIPGRDVMAQGWYQGGVSVFDFTDPAQVKEIAYFDRGPIDSTKMYVGGSWSAYWYNGYIYSSEIARGLDVFELQPSGLLSQNEIDAAKLVHFDELNVQDQQKLVWPAAFVVSRSYVDQLQRSGGLSSARITAVRGALAAAEQASGSARREALTQLASQLDGDAGGSSDAAKVETLAASVRALAQQ
ncbi:MAG TPA: hypothetical protein VH539_07885 [Gemmatimonadaceae bacterium]